MVCRPAFGQQHYWPDGPAPTRVAFFKEMKNPETFDRKPTFWEKLKQTFSNKPQHRFVRPMGLDVYEGLLAVADPGAGGVHLLDLNRHKYRFLSSDPDPETKTPTDVAVGQKTVYVTYSRSNIIKVFNFNGKRIKTITPPIPVGRLTGIACCSPHILAVDTPNHRALLMDESGHLLQTIGTRGEQEGGFNFPTMVTVSQNGNIYISDTMNFRVQAFTPEGVWFRTFGERGLMSGQLNRPKGVAVDLEENLYVVDSSFDNVQIFSKDGQFLLYFGSTGEGIGQFIMPTDVAIDGENIYVSDTMNQRIQIFEIRYD